MKNRTSEWLREAKIVSKILSNAPVLDSNKDLHSFYLFQGLLSLPGIR
ncbi:unnamed protein product [marine sediment metagenome]|uniref:Uncharacterized protein n=1 Tax=marine sediment metagenome TaxID=412755 RepID=X1BSN2_9ZZZZ